MVERWRCVFKCACVCVCVLSRGVGVSVSTFSILVLWLCLPVCLQKVSSLYSKINLRLLMELFFFFSLFLSLGRKLVGLIGNLGEQRFVTRSRWVIRFPDVVLDVSASPFGNSVRRVRKSDRRRGNGGAGNEPCWWLKGREEGSLYTPKAHYELDWSA